MANLIYMKTNKLTMPDIPIVSGQIINAADAGETYYDSDGGNRIRFDNVVYLYTEDDRLAYTNPQSGILYIVSVTAKMYKYKPAAGWIKAIGTLDMYDIIDIVEDLVPGTIHRDGTKIAPRTLATVVYTSKGERVEDKLNTISKLGNVSVYYKIPADNMKEFDIPIPFVNYFELGNFVEIYIGSTLFDARRYNIIGNKLILATTESQFAKDRDITYKFWFNSATPPVGVTYYIDGSYIIENSIPSSKLLDLYHNYDLGNPKLIASSLALNSAFVNLSDKLNAISGNLVAHALSAGPNGKELVTTIPNFTLYDNSTIYLKLHTSIEDGATLSVNASVPHPIYLNYKEPIKHGLVEGDILNVTYSAMYNKFFVNAAVAYKLQHYSTTYVAVGGESEILIDISEFEPNYDEVSVYHNSVRLVEEFHYRVSDRKILLIGYNCEPGDLFLIEMDKVKGNGLPVDGNTIMKELVFTEKVYFKNGVDITGDLDIKGNINLDGELHFSGGASSGSNFTAEQFVSTALAPLPPMIVNSEVVVDKFNADMVDGYHATQLIIPDNSIEFIIDGETDVLDPILQITFNAFYGRIEALSARMIVTENPDRPKAVKRNLFDSIPESSIDPTDPMYNSVVQDTIEDIVWKLDNLKYQMLATEACEYNVLNLNNMTGDEIRKGDHKDPKYLDFYDNIAEMNKSIDTELFSIEATMLISAKLDYLEPASFAELSKVLRAINDMPVEKTYSEVPTIVPRASGNTQSTATRAKYMLSEGKRIYPITHKNAIVGLPNAPLATTYDIEDLTDIITKLINRVEVLEATSGGGVTGKSFIYARV